MGIDYCQGVLAGIVRALGKQGTFTSINILSYYIIAIPMAVFFCFHQQMGIIGIWLGLICGILNQIVF